MAKYIIDLIFTGESETLERKNFWEGGGYYSRDYGEYHGQMGIARC